MQKLNKYILIILIKLVILIAVLVTIFEDCQIKHKKSILENIENLNIKKLYNLSQKYQYFFVF